MRKIELQVIQAINEKRSFTNDNTEVTIGPESTNVYLHGNLIATHGSNDHITVYDGGWESVTTKSRLNAIMGEFASGWGISQLKGVWYLIGPSDEKIAWMGKATFRNGSLVSFD